MDPRLRQSMNEYYNERAAEFDEIYTLGRPPGTVTDPELYKEEARSLGHLVREHCRGSVLDIPCGTGYWLQFYAANCSAITLVDQSENMLGEGREKTRAHGVEPITRFVKTDALEVSLEDRSYDAVLVGFFLSHVTDSQIDLFLQRLRNALKPGGRVVILDSNWTRFRGSRSKEGTTVRTLNDGRQYEIYKRYFEGADFVRMSDACEMDFTVQYEGKVYLAVTGTVRE
ncbi:MAG: class I SAM-dependent methyltransferase [Gemmatimonadetes bacterium]|nr:class I SAM-dependent methyltransferase [Gemmatimonadota bacterium]MYJ91179.1 class I SAM-dependent methyltransferase [Gemmatimonadota bacterium]